MATGTLSQLDEAQLRLEAELESVRRELDAYNKVNPNSSQHHRHSVVQPPSLHHPLHHHHSDSSLDNIDYFSRKRRPHRQQKSVDYDHGMGGENPFYGAHMMQVLLEQQARVYSKENEMMRKEMEQLKVSNNLYL